MENLENNTFSIRKSFRLYLKNELDQRIKKNPGYSLRSFAKGLNIDPSLLSKLINGKRKITDNQIEKLGIKLKLSLREIEVFKSYVEPFSKEENTYQLSLDQFDVISEWQHYAILEMMTLKNFEPDIHFVAKALNESVSNTVRYIETLKRVGLLEINEDGSWVDLSDGKSTHILDKNYTSYAHKQSQARILKKAIESLDSIEINKRDQSSMMVATNEAKINEAKDMITAFRRQLTEFLEDTNEKTTVYQTSFSLFPILNLE